jgi:uncharacterized protein YndB with AHSA1/START domain/DNA-binding transcriptional ArsR family regulator
MELVFKALADPSRRALLDRLFERDGQSLGQLCQRAGMTRFGVMKHLRVLEGAGLVTTRRSGRAKLHYLNPVPIRLIHDRWITKYAAPWVGALGDLKRELEEETMSATPTPASAAGLRHVQQIHMSQEPSVRKESAMGAPKHVYEVYIRTTPAKLWEAITKGEQTRQYFYGTTVESDWKVGSSVRHMGANGQVNLDGKVLESVPGERLVTTFSAVHDPTTAKDRPSRVTWEIQPLGEVCKLTLTHDDFDGITKTYEQVGPGWNPVLSGLKTLLETGRPLSIPMPAGAR